MVNTQEAHATLDASIVMEGQVFTIAGEETHHIVEAHQGTRVTKLVTLGVKESSKPITLNATSRKFLESRYGFETAAWAGKKVKAVKGKQVIEGVLKDTLFWLPEDVLDAVQEPRKK